MPYSNLSTWPLLVFGIIEPAAVTYAYMKILISPVDYYAAQAPNHQFTAATSFPPHALGLTLQFGNVLLLIAALALVCSWTPHREITKWYLLAVAFADLGHIYAVYVAVGAEYFWNVSEWNDMIWGNVGVSIFLHINRLLTLAGVFDSGKGITGSKKTI